MVKIPNSHFRLPAFDSNAGSRKRDFGTFVKKLSNAVKIIGGTVVQWTWVQILLGAKAA